MGAGEGAVGSHAPASRGLAEGWATDHLPGIPSGVFNPNSEDPLPGQLKKQLVLRIISGQQLPKPRDSMLGDRGEVGASPTQAGGVGVGGGPGIAMGPDATPAPVSQIIDPFVEVEIIGLPVDCSREQTRVVDDNGEAGPWLRHTCDGSLRGEGWGYLVCPGALPRPPSVTVLGALPSRWAVPEAAPGAALGVVWAGGSRLERCWAGPSPWDTPPGAASPGFNPTWEETLVFTVHMPEIALVRFLVWDHDPIGRDFIGQRTLAFSSMMPGGQEWTRCPPHWPRAPGQGRYSFPCESVPV